MSLTIIINHKLTLRVRVGKFTQLTQFVFVADLSFAHVTTLKLFLLVWGLI